MKHIESSNSLQQMHTLCKIPKNILKLHGDHNISEFVMHDLCCKDCFNFNKAAYLIDNPDFNCLQGVVGYNQDEAYQSDNIWDARDAFTSHMQQSPFNQKVRTYTQYSCKNCEMPDEAIMEKVAKELGMDTFAYCSWQMKHDNHGYLIYQSNEHNVNPETLLNGLSLLGFCPIF